MNITKVGPTSEDLLVTYIGEKPYHVQKASQQTWINYDQTARPLSPRRMKKYTGDLSKHPSELIFGSLNDYLAYHEAWENEHKVSTKETSY